MLVRTSVRDSRVVETTASWPTDGRTVRCNSTGCHLREARLISSSFLLLFYINDEWHVALCLAEFMNALIFHLSFDVTAGTLKVFLLERPYDEPSVLLGGLIIWPQITIHTFRDRYISLHRSKMKQIMSVLIKIAKYMCNFQIHSPKEPKRIRPWLVGNGLHRNRRGRQWRRRGWRASDPPAPTTTTVEHVVSIEREWKLWQQWQWFEFGWRLVVH